MVFPEIPEIPDLPDYPDFPESPESPDFLFFRKNHPKREKITMKKTYMDYFA